MTPHLVQGKPHTSLAPVTLRLQTHPLAASSRLSHGALVFPGVSQAPILWTTQLQSPAGPPGQPLSRGLRWMRWHPHTPLQRNVLTHSPTLLWLLFLASTRTLGSRASMFLCNLLCGDLASPSLWNGGYTIITATETSASAPVVQPVTNYALAL